VSLAVANGLYFTFSVFLVPLVDEFHWSRGLTAGALSLSTVLQGLLSPVAGILVDRFGPRRVILSGAVLLSAASILTATIRSAWELYLYTGLLGAIGLVGLGPVPMGVLLARWFSARRGRAVGIAFSGMGFGVFVTGPLAQWLIASMGWRVASAILGLGALLILVPIAWIGARDPEPRTDGPAPRPAGPQPHDGLRRARRVWSRASAGGVPSPATACGAHVN
jgi:MFS family permease